ncbi:hypothetical protein ABU178_19575 [Pantoea osteomyelitidis]|uniref:Uncharacterized protein n=1 Tax=Pantoea osteomyelitidis TaxID=3230026 RepID=A0ABW7Q195_9GAMM
MFDQILAAIKIRQELPDAIGYAFIEKQDMFEIPNEISKDLSEETLEKIEQLSCLYFRVDNFTTSVQKNIRVLMSGSYEYLPRLIYQRRDVDVGFEVMPDLREILINEVFPNDSVIIQFYNPDKKFNVDQVLIKEKTITPTMQKLAYAKRHPDLAKMTFTSSLLILILSCLTIFSIFFGAYAYLTRSAYEEKISEFTENSNMCKYELFENSADKEKELDRKFLQLGEAGSITLLINKVPTLAELKLKDTVVLCVPTKPHNKF